MSNRIQFRRDTRARWAEINPVLMEGEVGLEIDTQNIKMGDGVTPWNDLEYGIGYSNVTNEPGNNENLVISQKGVTELVRGITESVDGITRRVARIKGVISSSDDLDSKKEISDIGLWFVSRTRDPGIVLVCMDFKKHCVQVKLSATRNVSVNETTNKPSIQYRKYIDNAWTEWTEIEFNNLKTHILQADGIAIQGTSLAKYVKTIINPELAGKFDKASIVQESGDSEELVMSQKAVSDKLKGLSTGQEIIYDVSARNNGVVFESLSALLSSSDLSTLIPTSVRHGGMSIRFMQSSNNKYVQYRLMSQNFTTDTTQWQGVDDEPTVGSDNLVKSGGVYDALEEIKNTSDNKVLAPSEWSYATLGAGKSLLYSDTEAGNIGDKWTLKLVFECLNRFEDYIVAKKGDYTTNGWGLVFKKGNPNVLCLIVNGIEYQIATYRGDFSQKLSISLVSSNNSIKVYLYGKLIIDENGLNTSANSNIEIGVSNKYANIYLIYMSFIKKVQSIEDIIDELKIIHNDFSLINLDPAMFVACPLTSDDYGYSYKGKSLHCQTKVTFTSLSFNYVGKDEFGIVDLFDGYIVDKYSNIQLNIFTQDISVTQNQNNYYQSKMIDITNKGVIKVSKIPLQDFDTIHFYSKDGAVIKVYHGRAFEADIYPSDGYKKGKTDVSFNVPEDAVYCKLHLFYDSVVSLVDKEAGYVTPQILQTRQNVIYRKTPAILFESDQIVAGKNVKYWNSIDDYEIPVVSQNDRDIVVSTTYLSYIKKYIPCNICYVTESDESGMLFVYRDTDDGTLHILDETYPSNIVKFSTHTWHGEGGMHLSTACSKYLAKKIIESTSDVSNYEVKQGKTGWFRCNEGHDSAINAPIGKYFIDPNNNKCFSVISNNSIENYNHDILQIWGIYDNSLTSYLLKGTIHIRQHALFKYGYYEYSAVAPKMMYVSGENISAPAVVKVFNNGIQIYEKPLCDYLCKTERVYLDDRNDYIYNVNKEVGGSSYSIASAIKAIPDNDRKPYMMIQFKTSPTSRGKVYRFYGDNLNKFTTANNWEEVVWGDVDIVIEPVTENTEIQVFLKRIMQYETRWKFPTIPINKDSYVAWLGDSWTGCDDVASDPSHSGEAGVYEELDNYDYSDTKNVQPTKNSSPSPLPRTLRTLTGCKLDLWGKGTKTSKWAWDYQIKELLKHNYTHVVIEFFTNDGSSMNDNLGEVSAMARMLQNSGIIPIIFCATHNPNDSIAPARIWATNREKWIY